MKYFKEFCAYKIHTGIYGDTYFGHSFQDGKSKYNSDFNLLGKDLSFTINPELNLKTYDGIENRVKRFKEAFENVVSFNKKMTEEKFLDFDIGVELKMDMTVLSPGISLKNIMGIGRELSTESVWIAGDGCDWGEGEYTSGHDSEIIIKATFGKRESFLTEYKEWSDEKELQITASKEARQIKKNKP